MGLSSVASASMQPRALAAGKVADRRHRLVGGKAETAELRAHLLFGELGAQPAQRLDRRRRAVEFVELMLREIAGHQLARAHHLAAHRLQLAGEQLGQRRFAVAVLAQQRDAVVGIEAQDRCRESTGLPGS